MYSRQHIALVGAVVLGACAHAPPPPAPRPEPMRTQVVADSIVNVAMPDMQWGIEVWDQGRNRLLYAHDSPRKFVPASNTKIVVTTTAMALLGPDWRYQTRFEQSGDNIVIRASGDPSWSARFFGGDLAVLDMFADSLTRNGVKKINDVVVDASIFAAEKVHSAWEVGDLPWYYATPTAAFAVGEAATTMIVRANAANAEVLLPDAPQFLPVTNQVRMDTAGARRNVDVDYEAWPSRLVVTGSMPPNSADTSFLAEPDPETFAARALVDALKRHGIAVNGAARVLRDSADLRSYTPSRGIFTFQSPPLHDIVAGLLKPSQNWIAEQLLKTVGAVKSNRGSWRGGIQTERRFLIDVVHIDSTQFSLSDGSGLSAQNVVSPHAFVMLLEYARTSPWGQLYHDALPAPGMKGGTLSNRLLGLETRLAAKTGSIANVNSLSGYIRTESGRDLTFSIITNTAGRSAADVRRAMDTIVRALASEKIVD